MVPRVVGRFAPVSGIPCLLVGVTEVPVGLTVATVALLKAIIKNKFEFIFENSGIQLHYFPKRIIIWEELQNVILKDGLLTIDFKNNMIIQSEILPAESNFINEAEFNEFCRSRLESIN